jgi:hypothetical protein
LQLLGLPRLVAGRKNFFDESAEDCSLEPLLKTAGRPLQLPKEASAKLQKHLQQSASQTEPRVVLQLVRRPQKLHQHLHLK